MMLENTIDPWHLGVDHQRQGPVEQRGDREDGARGGEVQGKEHKKKVDAKNSLENYTYDMTRLLTRSKTKALSTMGCWPSTCVPLFRMVRNSWTYAIGHVIANTHIYYKRTWVVKHRIRLEKTAAGAEDEEDAGMKPSSMARRSWCRV